MESEMRCVYVYKRAQNPNANCFGVKNENSSSSSIHSAALDAYRRMYESECMHVHMFVCV